MKRSFFLLLWSLPFLAWAQQYKLTIDNIHQPNGMCNQLEFDIYLRNMSTDTYYLNAFQGGINFNYAGMCNGGTITSSFVPGSSYDPTTNTQLNAPLNNPTWYISQSSHQIRCQAAILTSLGAAAILPTAAPGIKLGTLRLTNTVPFTAYSTPDFSWSFITASNQTKTAVVAWLNGSGSPMALTNQTSFNYNNQGPECYVNGNPILLTTPINATISYQIFPESCIMSNDGAINVTITPSSAYSYLWSNGATTEDLMNVTSGNYTISLQSGSSGCLSQTMTIPLIGLNCGTVQGQVFHDSNNDCIFNGNEGNVSNVIIQLSNGSTAITNTNGVYAFNAVNFGSYSIQMLPSTYLNANTCIQPDSVHLTTTQPTANPTFKVIADTSTNLRITISGQTLVPGFSREHWINIKNLSTNPAFSSVVSFIVNPNLSFESATPGYTIYPSSLGDSIVWYTGMLPLETKQFVVKTLVPTNLALGIPITCCGHIELLGQVDIFPTNNHYCRTTTTTGSFDPNDKQVNPIGMGPNGIITLSDTILDYTIQFQNTGTAEAINVSIKDTLSNKLDWNTLEILSASHPYMVLIPSPGVILFKFDNILLPDSNTNEPLSHGYISYRIKQKNTNVLGDVIQNKADIVFDFNVPVITNITTNTIGSLSPLGVQNPMEVLPELFPNPISNELTISYSSPQALLFELFDVTGRLVFRRNLLTEKSKEQITLPAQLNNGVYQYRISSESRNLRTGKVEIRR